jgi:hypothetical protein
MRIPPILWRWAALGALGTVVAAGAWLMAIQALLVLFSPVGYWQLPKVSKVVVLRIDKDPEKNFTDRVVVKHGEKERALEMLKEEIATLRPEDELWILDNYYYTRLRPAQFRLSPLRLALEYPLPLMLVAVCAIRWILRRRLGLPPEPVLNPDVPRIRIKDDYHLRAQRFSPTDVNRSEPPQNA